MSCPVGGPFVFFLLGVGREGVFEFSQKCKLAQAKADDAWIRFGAPQKNHVATTKLSHMIPPA